MKIAALALATAAFAFPAAAQEDPKVRDLIRQLGSEDFQTRENATLELKKIGRPAEEALRGALSNEDPEVRARARQILEDLEQAGKPRADAPKLPRRVVPGLPGLAFRGASVQVTSVNGDSTTKITPGDGSAPITFHKAAGGSVKLEYQNDKGESKTAEAESIEKFVKDHKELAEKFGITEGGINYAGARTSFKGGGGGFSGAPFPRGGFRFRGVPQGDEEDLNEFLNELLGERRGARAGGATFEPVPDALRAQFEIPEGEGLVVGRVSEGSAAEAAGLRKNDVLLEVDGKKVSSAKGLAEALKKPGSLTVLRKGQREKLTASDKKDY